MLNPIGAPSILKGSIVIVDPDVTVKNEDIVVEKLDTSKSVALKQITIEYPDKHLKALNTD